MMTNKMQLFWFVYLFLISSTCFCRCIRPSSRALDCAYSFWYPQMLLPAGVVDALELYEFQRIYDTSRQQHLWIPEAVSTIKCS